MHTQASVSASVQIVKQWLAAVNAQEIDTLLALSAAYIQVIGPRGVGQGHQLLRDWLARAGLQLHTLRLFARENHVVVAQHGRWHAPGTHELLGEADLASRFIVEKQQVVEYARYETLETALDDAGLSLSDEQPLA